MPNHHQREVGCVPHHPWRAEQEVVEVYRVVDLVTDHVTDHVIDHVIDHVVEVGLCIEVCWVLIGRVTVTAPYLLLTLLTPRHCVAC